MNVAHFRIIGWLASGLCLAASTGIILNRQSAFAAANQRASNASMDLEKAHEAEAAVEHQPKEDRYACAVRESSEETRFITDLRQRARLAGVTIVRWSSHATTYEQKTGDGPPKAEDSAKKVIEGVTRVQCDLALDGSYQGLRTFLAGLWTADRLFSLSNIDWGRTGKASRLSMALVRYVAPEEAKPASTPSSSGISEGT